MVLLSEAEARMEQTVYVDLLFLVNFSMDFLCLYITSRLFSRPPHGGRTAAAAAVGGLYSVLRLFCLPDGFFGFCADMVCALLLVWIAFRGENPLKKNFWILVVSFFVTNMLLGGIMTAIFSLLNRLSPPDADSIIGEEDMPLWILIPVGILSAAATLLGQRSMRRKSRQTKATVTLEYGGRQASFAALCDTGHLLRDPFLGREILLADHSVSRELLPSDCRPSDTWKTENLSTLPDGIRRRLTLVPAATACRPDLLFAFRPDRAFLSVKGQKLPIDVLVGFSALSGNLGDCRGLFPPTLLP